MFDCCFILRKNQNCIVQFDILMGISKNVNNNLFSYQSPKYCEFALNTVNVNIFPGCYVRKIRIRTLRLGISFMKSYIFLVITQYFICVGVIFQLNFKMQYKQKIFLCQSYKIYFIFPTVKKQDYRIRSINEPYL